jgi:Uma2 family endonuclease
MVISEQTFRLVALEDAEGLWELHDGRLVEKPGMGAEHNDAIVRLGLALGPQLDWRTHRLRINMSHVRRSERNYYIPDLCVIPSDRFHDQLGQPGHLELYEAPLPLVVEAWSPSTGTYDVEGKLLGYQARGDREIWRLHPFERTLTTWRREPDGTYAVEVYRGGVVPVMSLPDVTVDFDRLFDFS